MFYSIFNFIRTFFYASIIFIKVLNLLIYFFYTLFLLFVLYNSFDRLNIYIFIFAFIFTFVLSVFFNAKKENVMHNIYAKKMTMEEFENRLMTEIELEKLRLFCYENSESVKSRIQDYDR